MVLHSFAMFVTVCLVFLLLLMWTSTFCLVHRLYTISRSKVSFSIFQITFISGIAISNILQTTLGTTVLLVASLRGGFYDNGALCQLEGFMTSTCAFLVINQLTVLCVFANRSNGCSPLKSIPVLVGACWSVGVILPSLPFVGVGRYVVQRTRRYCCLNWDSTNAVDKWYFYVLFTLEFTIPFVLIICSKIKQINGVKNNSFERNESMISNARVFCIAMVFLMMWLPYGVHVLMVLCDIHTPEYIELGVLIFALTSFAIIPFMFSRELWQVTRMKDTGNW